MIFDYFSLHELEMLNLRNASDYLTYVHLGGRLTVLNTKGYPGYIANRLVDSQEVKETKLLTTFDNTSIPIVEGKLGQGKIRYVNLGHLLSGIEWNDTSPKVAYTW